MITIPAILSDVVFARRWHRTVLTAVQVLCMSLLGVTFAQGQGLGAGAVQGTVKDPTGGVMQAVDVRLSNPVSGFTRTATTDAMGHYQFNNLPPNPYHLVVEAQGFRTLERT